MEIHTDRSFLIVFVYPDFAYMDSCLGANVPDNYGFNCSTSSIIDPNLGRNCLGQLEMRTIRNEDDNRDEPSVDVFMVRMRRRPVNDCVRTFWGGVSTVGLDIPSSRAGTADLRVTSCPEILKKR